jgi:hypothetical protein
MAGNYTIICSVWYGNLPECLITTRQEVDIIEVPAPADALMLFPNPASQHVVIYGPLGESPWDVFIIDVFGRVVWQNTLTPFGGSMQIPVAQLPSGYYQVHLQNNTGSLEGKLIVSRSQPFF